jgi:hypothetical protein
MAAMIIGHGRFGTAPLPLFVFMFGFSAII